ncbi:hypothetical protein Q7C36_003934 [Tachysurus vachellii]|uniref:SAND domain-containing protein n=1 Tax=Tachysurus vachellii TaxID=175792 RepID=A0AA88T9S2_TACVA|nr:hypothetical protein Q7C36_003934 [Tachysurus vachellii]
MNISQFNLIPLEQLITFFRRKKTEISSQLDDPQLFFDHLKDHESFLLSQNLPWPEKPTGNEEKQVEQKKCGTKRKKSVDETEEEDAGPFSVSSSSQKKLLSGSHSKSIHTEEGWITPEEFVKQELTLTDRHWKKDILCHGKTLDYLVKVT